MLPFNGPNKFVSCKNPERDSGAQVADTFAQVFKTQFIEGDITLWLTQVVINQLLFISRVFNISC